MEMEDEKRDALQDRLEGLEKTIAFQNRVGVVALLAVIFLLSIQWLALKPSKDMQAKSLEFRDETGTLRTRLALASDGSPEFSMFDHQGIKLVTLGQTYQSSSALSFYDEGEPRLQLSSISKGVASLRFMNDDKEIQSSLYIRPDRGMGMSLASGGEGLFLGMEPDGKPGFRMVDINAVKEGRTKLAVEELERFALPAKSTEKPLEAAVDGVPKVSTLTKPFSAPESGTAAWNDRSDSVFELEQLAREATQ